MVRFNQFDAGADITALTTTGGMQMVKIASDGDIEEVTTSDGNIVLGVLYQDVEDGDKGITVLGPGEIVKLRSASTSVLAGSRVKLDGSDAEEITVIADADNPAKVIGIALEKTSAINDVIDVLLI